jgi:hypothetical protein
MHIAEEKNHFRFAVWGFDLMCCLPNRIPSERIGMKDERRER